MCYVMRTHVFTLGAASGAEWALLPTLVVAVILLDACQFSHVIHCLLHIIREGLSSFFQLLLFRTAHDVQCVHSAGHAHFS
jgi:hypothetical protein